MPYRFQYILYSFNNFCTLQSFEIPYFSTGVSGGIRTRYLRSRNPELYPYELQTQFVNYSCLDILPAFRQEILVISPAVAFEIYILYLNILYLYYIAVINFIYFCRKQSNYFGAIHIDKHGNRAFTFAVCCHAYFKLYFLFVI